MRNRRPLPCCPGWKRHSQLHLQWEYHSVKRFVRSNFLWKPEVSHMDLLDINMLGCLSKISWLERNRVRLNTKVRLQESNGRLFNVGVGSFRGGMLDADLKCLRKSHKHLGRNSRWVISPQRLKVGSRYAKPDHDQPFGSGVCWVSSFPLMELQTLGNEESI